MRLLHIHSHTFREFHGENIPPYLIASHRWTDNETSFKDVLKKRNRDSIGWRKIVGFCERAEKDNNLLKSFENATCCEWIWIDTACIDKRSSAEVSESINSMFAWYSDAQECHAYLADVRPFPASQQLSDVLEDFRESEWFKRGWTLQELLAPRCVVFFTQTWQIIGHKCADCSIDKSCPGAGPLLNTIISEITGVPEDVLGDFERSRSATVEEKMRWQAGRRTTRIEDRAYCLLGMFDVHMPLLYGEGEKAMARLERTVLEELERPWRSQLRPDFDLFSDASAESQQSSKQILPRSGRPSAIMRQSDVDGEVACICGFDDDDGWLVACDICQYWQHAICYFPGPGDEPSLSANQEHRCLRCCPREMDMETARSTQVRKRSRGSVTAASKRKRIDDDGDNNMPAKRERSATDAGFGGIPKESPVPASASEPLEALEICDDTRLSEPSMLLDGGPYQCDVEKGGSDFDSFSASPSPIRSMQIGQHSLRPSITSGVPFQGIDAVSVYRHHPAASAGVFDLPVSDFGWPTTVRTSSMPTSVFQPVSFTDSAAEPFATDLFKPPPGLSVADWTVTQPFFGAPQNDLPRPVCNAFSAPATMDSLSAMQNKGECSLDSRGRWVKDVAAHARSHMRDGGRPEKCPIPSCEYHIKGFARKYDQQRHVLTHYKGEMACPFCQAAEGTAAKTFNRADVLKRHLTIVHGVEQNRPSHRREGFYRKPDGASVGGSRSSGICSVCSSEFNSPQSFYDHLDGCVLRVVSQTEAAPTRKSYTCSHLECAAAGVKFSRRAELHRHSMIRHGEETQMHNCPECAWSSPRRDKLMEHRRQVHGVDIRRRG